MKLKCYSQILCQGSAENFRFWFNILYWFDGKLIKTRNPEAELEETDCLLGQTCQFLLINYFRSDNILNKEVNGATIHVIVLNSLEQNSNGLKNSAFKVPTWIWTYWWHTCRKMMLKSLKLKRIIKIHTIIIIPIWSCFLGGGGNMQIVRIFCMDYHKFIWSKRTDLSTLSWYQHKETQEQLLHQQN